MKITKYIMLLLSFIYVSYADSYLSDRLDSYYLNPISNNAITQINEIAAKNAWDRVLEIHKGIEAEKLKVKQADKLKLAAKLSFLPEINLQALYLHLGSKIELDLIRDRAKFNQIQSDPIVQNNPALQHLFTAVGTPITLMEQDSIMGALNILYPLYAGGARYYGSKIASVLAKDSREALRLKELATFEEFIGIYYAVSLNKQILTAANNTQENAKNHYENAKKLHRLGQIAQVELLTAEVAYNRAKNAALSAKNTLEISQLALNSILELDNVVTKALPIIDSNKLKGLNYYMDNALDSYPALKVAKNSKDIAKYNSKLAFGSFMPKVGVFGHFMLTDNRSKMQQMMPNWFVGIGANWSLLSADSKLQKYQIAKIGELSASALEEQAIKDMKILVEKVYKQLIFTSEEYMNLESSINLATQNLLLQEKAFSQGLATSTQVNDARSALFNAFVERESLAYKEIVLFARLMALCGDIDGFFTMQY